MRPVLTVLLSISIICAPATVAAFERETSMVTMRDGIRLATDAYYPGGPDRVPTILMRTPYGRDFVPDLVLRLLVDGLGYAFVTQDTRGRGDSEGFDDVFLSDGWGNNQDGYDTIDWIATQDWSDEQVGMLGVSALGIATYLAAGAAHPSLKVAEVGLAPSLSYAHAGYQGGIFREALLVDWLEGQDSPHMLDVYAAHPLNDDFWAQFDLSTRFDDITVPILHWGGWHDVFAEGPIAAFQGLDAAPLAGPQRLVMGPWTHIDAGPLLRRQGELVFPRNSRAVQDLNPLPWFDRFLKGSGEDRLGDLWPVRYYVMGDVDDPRSAGNHWERARGWPVPADDYVLYLRADGTLGPTRPFRSGLSVGYTSDPADPTPTIGGRELSLPAGPRDQSTLAERDDVIVFETAPLSEPVKVVGLVTARLWIDSDGPDTDFMVRLNDVYPDGRAMLVSDGALKVRYRSGFDRSDFLKPGEVAPIDVEIGSSAIVFDRGHRIQIMVASTNHRRFKIGHNTDADIWADVEPRMAHNQVYTSAEYPSAIVLPRPRACLSCAMIERPDWRAEDLAAALKRVETGERPTDAEYRALRHWVGIRLLTSMLNADRR